MIAVMRFRVAEADTEGFCRDARAALEVLAARPGWVRGRLARNTDEPDLWALTTEWVGVGAYRRALSSYEAKLTAVPLLARCVHEPTAYEVIDRVGE